MPTKQLALGAQIIHGTTREGEWVTEKLTGWYETPATKGNEEERALADGDYDAQLYYASRMITIDGILFFSNRGLAIQALEALAVASSLASRALIVTDFGLTRFANVKSQGVDFTPMTTNAIRWQIRLKATDPYKYGEAQSFSGAVGSGFDVYQRGTVPANAVVTVTGSFPGGYELTLGGRLVSVTRAVTSGSPHVLDMRTGILRVGGAVARSGFEYAELFKVQPGIPQNFYSVARTSGSGTVKLAFNDTFI